MKSLSQEMGPTSSFSTKYPRYLPGLDIMKSCKQWLWRPCSLESNRNLPFKMSRSEYMGKCGPALGA